MLGPIAMYITSRKKRTLNKSSKKELATVMDLSCWESLKRAPSQRQHVVNIGRLANQSDNKMKAMVGLFICRWIDR